MIQRTFAKVGNVTKSTASFVASNTSQDRYGDIVDQSWLLENYRRSPVILLNHRQDMLPIGKATNVNVVEGQLEIDVEFDTEDQLGSEVARKVERGFLSAVSVGFQPRKATPRSELDVDHFAYSEKGGMYFEQNELLEVSVVTIPANGEAVAKGLSFEELHLKELIKSEVRSQLFSLPTDHMLQLKHIINVEELDDSFVVTYAKSIDQEDDPTEDFIEESKKDEEDSEDYDSDTWKAKTLLTLILST